MSKSKGELRLQEVHLFKQLKLLFFKFINFMLDKGTIGCPQSHNSSPQSRRERKGVYFFCFPLTPLLAGHGVGKQKDPSQADYSSNSFTIRTMPSLIRVTLKFKSSPNLMPDNLLIFIIILVLYELKTLVFFLPSQQKEKYSLSLRPQRLCGEPLPNRTK